MNDWVHDLPVVWMAMQFFGATYIVTAIIYAAVVALATGERARAFKSASPGMLPPLGILFALFVAFTAQQVWGDNDRGSAALNREASALRAAVVLAAGWPAEPQARLNALIRRYITEAANVEWPMMAKKTADLTLISRDLSEALELTLSLTPGSQGQQIAQHEIISELEVALAARHERVIISKAQVNLLKWSAL